MDAWPDWAREVRKAKAGHGERERCGQRLRNDKSEIRRFQGSFDELRNQIKHYSAPYGEILNYFGSRRDYFRTDTRFFIGVKEQEQCFSSW